MKIDKLINIYIYISCMYYKKVLITVEKYVNAGVHTIKGNRELFWVKMTDVQKDWF